MRILIITHLIPYPLSEGGRISQYALIDYLRKKCAITLLLFIYNERDALSVIHLKEVWQDVNFEIISFLPVGRLTSKRTPKSLFKSSMAALLHKCTKLYDKHLAEKPINGKADGDGIIHMIDFVHLKSRSVIDQISVIIKKCSPALIQVEFIYLLDLVYSLPKEIKKIFVHHELRFPRFNEIQSNESAAYRDYLTGMCTLNEVEVLKQYDAVLTLCEYETVLLKNRMATQNIYTSPFSVLDADITNTNKINADIQKLVFVGGELHPPNKDAVAWYSLELGKEMYSKYNLTLHVIGHWTEETKRLYSNNEAVKFTGYIEDIKAYCKHSVMLVPIRLGGGIRTKILYGMAWGVPVISTTIGSSGIVYSDTGTITANTADEFKIGIAKLLTDKPFQHALINKAQLIIKANYTQEIAGEKRYDIYKTVLAN